jgi:hypothetical protein
MVPLRHWKPQQGLERPVNAGHREQILTTAHMGDALGRIIHHHGNMVAGRTILAAQNHVPQFLRAADLVSGPHVPPQQGARNPRRGVAVQPPRKGLAGFEKLLPAPLVKQAAGSRINVHAAALRRAAHGGHLLRNLPARAETGVQHPAVLQRLEGMFISAEA